MTRPTVPAFPLRVLMDTRAACNLKCPDCQVHGRNEHQKFVDFTKQVMPLGESLAILDQLQEAPQKPLLQPLLWSEPLLSKTFCDVVRAAKQRGMAVSINTNGLLLTDDMARFMVDVELDCVAISIDAVTPETLIKVRGIDKLDKIHRAVSAIVAARGDRLLPRIGVSFTCHDANLHEHDAFLKRWVGEVDFVRVQEVFVDGRFPHLDVQGERQACPSLYHTLVINANGDVSICCLDTFGDTVVGNVFEEGVQEVWLGERFTEIRRLHETGQGDKVPLCRDCVRWSVQTYSEEISGNILIRRSPEMTYYNRIDRLSNWNGSLIANHQKSADVSGSDEGGLSHE